MNQIRKILNTEITRKKPYLILEAGVNHEGSLDNAFEMIDAAADAGADMIKFQSYKAETLASKNSPSYWDRTKEPSDSQYKLFQKHDSFGDEEYRKLAERSAEKGIVFSSTAFDSHFVDFLDRYMPVYKIASADLTNTGLLHQIAGKNKPVLLSTGASHLGEIDEAVRTLVDGGASEICLMHCILQYPTEPENSNLNAITHLKSAFPDVTMGWSDHVPPHHNSMSMVIAWMMGADILEKHYTLDKTLPGNDHYHAMDPDDVRNFIKSIDYASSLLGENIKRVYECEADSRKYARRSLVAASRLEAGKPVLSEQLIAKRPGLGIDPRFADIITGRKPILTIEEDTILQWDMFIGS